MTEPVQTAKTSALTLPAASGEDAIEKVKYDPLAPIGNAGNMKNLLERNAAAIAALLPKHVTVERLIRTMLVATNRNPDLLRCTQASLVESIMRAAELGLDLSGTLGEAYLVPFRNKVKFKDSKGIQREEFLDQAQMLPGYRGLAKLARQSGEVSRIAGAVVYEQDEFEYEEGLNFKLRHVPNFKAANRGKAILVWSLIVLKDGSPQALVMTVAEVEKIRLNAKSKNSPAWADWWEEMAKKTCFRRNSKMAPMSNEKFRQAIEADNTDTEFDLGALTSPEQLQATTETSRTEALASRLTGKEAAALGEGAITTTAGAGAATSLGEALGADAGGQEAANQPEGASQAVADGGNEAPSGEPGRPRFNVGQCTSLRAAMKTTPVLDEADVACKLDDRPSDGQSTALRDDAGAKSIAACEGFAGETPADFYTRALLLIQAMKAPPANGKDKASDKA